MSASNRTIDAETVEGELLAFLAERVGSPVTPEQDLFSAGLVSSMFAMQLVVHLEDSYDLEIVGPELTLEHFRSVRRMTELVLRLSAGAESDG
ncbi:acyl carrier protein [Sciscionella marina]|uniref:acyl carrier protein n=1 Tax=Sciscionella marina TaxID=508770 RepID=UPI0003675026|nr:phosphopantetheine-binding protein [Sciscionella marina]